MAEMNNPIFAKVLFSAFVVGTAILFGLLLRKEWVFTRGWGKVAGERAWVR